MFTALKEHIDSLKRQFRDKQFIIESLLANLQHHYYNNSLSSGNQILIQNKTQKKYWFAGTRSRWFI